MRNPAKLSEGDAVLILREMSVSIPVPYLWLCGEETADGERLLVEVGAFMTDTRPGAYGWVRRAAIAQELGW